jgi:tRNA pseudouridine13 synthase
MDSSMESLDDLIVRDRAALLRAKEEVPDAFLRAPLIDTPEILKSVGIEAGIPEDAPLGCIKLFPQDFLVEEVLSDGTVVSVQGEPSDLSSSSGQTLYADLVQCGLGTLEARERIARAYGIPNTTIGYAGIKDKAAMTSQRISLRGMYHEMEDPSFVLRPVSYGKGAVSPGELKGNRFTLVVRTRTSSDAERAAGYIEGLRADGFWNFFYLQRFGTPRLFAHRIGREIVAGRHEEAVRIFCTESMEREIPYLREIRVIVGELWGNWDAIITLLDRFPYRFRHELTITRYLKDHSGDFIGALKAVPDQTKIWVYAYQSYLWNRLLSRFIKTGDVPLHIPLITPGSLLYTDFLREIGEPDFVLPKPFPFVRPATDPVLSFISPDIHGIHVEGPLVILSFTLPKGAYATSLLMHAVHLVSGPPTPQGIPKDKIDAPPYFGRPSLLPLLERFKEPIAYWEQAMVDEV